MFKKKKRGDYSRREFLYLMLGSSAGLLGVGACGATAWAMQPQLHWGVELFRFDPKDIPPPNTAPRRIAEGKFWLSNTDQGLRALYQVCMTPNCGCRYGWVNLNDRFECPCRGAPYALDGRAYGVGRRNLCQFNVEVTTPQGVLSTNGQAIPVNATYATSIVVNTQKLILGGISDRDWG